jgi:Putative transposase/Transposase zinc-binding domain
MGALQEVFRRHAPAYLDRFAATMPVCQRSVIDSILACRTRAAGQVIYQCERCGEPHVAPRSCGNRHCPGCQQPKAEDWLEHQVARALPTHYFMLTFTVPASLREFIRAHPREGYAALFEASSAAIKALAADPRHLGARTCGFFGVLHTWGRTLQYHPHLHYVVPGGGFDREGRWVSAERGFFLPVRALSKLYRGKFREAMRGAGLLREIDAAVWDIDWNVNCQAVGEAGPSLAYLARYVFKVAISESRIVHCDDSEVAFRYRKAESSRARTMRLAPDEFMRRFLQHVLPGGFMKLRHFGFLSSSCKMPIEEVRARIELAHGFALTAREKKADDLPAREKRGLRFSCRGRAACAIC